jgi:hypothetical protein
MLLKPNSESGQSVSPGKYLLAPFIAVLFCLAFQITYDLLDVIDNVSLYRTLAATNWVLLVISTGFSVVLIYPIAYFMGLPLRKRILISYIVPAVWCIMEFVRVSSDVNAIQALFYSLLTSVQLLLLISQILFMGLCEIGCRWFDKKRGKNIRVFTVGPAVAVIFSMIPLYFILIYESGHVFALAVRMLYRDLFL